MTPYTVSKTNKTAANLAGWAFRGQSAADCIANVDSTGEVIGAGTTSYKLPHPLTRRPVHIGCRELSQNTPVCASALFATEGWFPLANCQTEIAIPK